MSRITLVVPAFNEKGNIGPFLSRCQEVEKASSHVFDYVFIDDGSSDGTYEEIERVCANNPNAKIRGIRFSRNFGKEAGILAGLRHSEGDYTVIIDADMQQDPSYVVQMADFLDNNPDYDCVACYQKDRKEGFFMKLSKKLFYKFMDEASDTHFEEDASDFRMLRREMVEAALQLGEYHRFSKGIFSWVGFNTHFMPYEVMERHSGQTTWTFKKLTKYAIDGIIGFSTAPLRASIWLGIIASLASLLFLIFNIIKTIAFGRDVPGYATIVCLILLVGGIQMVLLGIMGEYISKIFIESKKRPIYIIKDTVGVNRNHEAGANDLDRINSDKEIWTDRETKSDRDEREIPIEGEEVIEGDSEESVEDNGSEFKWEKI